MKSQSTVGAGDSMVGAMTLKLAQGASLLEMTRYGVAAGSAATINQGTRSVRWPIRKKSSITCPEINVCSPSSAGTSSVAKRKLSTMLRKLP
jgi:fructose-1-phosphate kinase PfkB-like protein